MTELVWTPRTLHSRRGRGGTLHDAQRQWQFIMFARLPAFLYLGRGIRKTRAQLHR